MVNGKKGQQMTLTTLIAIILGIAVLVFLIWGFSVGWSNMWDQIGIRTSGSNVELRVQDCQNDCEKNEVSAFCKENKELRFFNDEGKIVKIKDTCEAFTTASLSEKNEHYQKVFNGAKEEIGFTGCPSIKCE